MDASRFDGMVRRMGRRGVVAVLGAGIGAAAVGWLRPREAAALPYCGNCDSICDNCDQSYDEATGRYRNLRACVVCGHCVAGWCSTCREPDDCD